MRSLVWALALIFLMPSVAARAGEAVNLVGQVTTVYQYPKKQIVCLVFESDKQQRFFICDDVTEKPVIESLFELGKQNAKCRIEGAVAKKNGQDVYLRVTGFSKAQQ